MEQYDRREERTGVQESHEYTPTIDIGCDFVMVYGLHNLKERIKQWKSRGYIVHLMTGVAWGNYQDYLYGKFDGIDHHDEGQVERGGREINHGKDVPYMVPSISFSRYLTQQLKYAIDCGIDAIHLEEPEFWTRAGYSEAFKREWQLYYREPWQDPRSSAEAQYRASKLKQYLYTRMLDRLCSELKEYALTKHGRLLRFFVPTHSLINYSQWMICSPESALVDLPGIDGYIAQIWTGTSRTPNNYEGITRERTFETAFLEYGIMQELVRGTGKRMWFLHDPVEDNPKYTWTDYRVNYYRTVTASLLHPGIYHYEVSPWPNRVFNGKYPTEDGTSREGMPADYRTNLLTVMQTLRNMKQDEVRWRDNVTEVGLLLADSAMFQRIYPDGDERESESRDTFDSFYGLALPLLKHGLAVRPVQLDNVRRYASYLAPYKALVLSYEYMKPEFPDINNAIAGWVRSGGLLVYVGDGRDSFHNIRAWWNQGADYENPAEHLFEACGLPRNPGEGIHECGRGYICYMNAYSADIARSKELADSYRALVREGITKLGIDWQTSSRLILDRGPYTVTAIMDESESGSAYTLEGRYVNLYETLLPIVENPVLLPGSVGLWYNLDRLDKTESAEVIATAARLEKFKATSRSCSFIAKGAAGSECVIRLYVKKPPKSVTAGDVNVVYEFDEHSSTVLLKFSNSPDGVHVTIKF